MKDYIVAVSRVQTWVRDYGESKQVQFISDIKTICDALLEKTESPANSPASPVQQLKAEIASIVSDMKQKASESTVGVGLTLNWARKIEATISRLA